MAQVSGRGFLSFHETNLKDVQYVIGKSWWNDIKIIIKTVISVFKGSGAF